MEPLPNERDDRAALNGAAARHDAVDARVLVVREVAVGVGVEGAVAVVQHAECVREVLISRYNILVIITY